MTRIEAMRSIMVLSSGTLAVIFNTNKYKEIDENFDKMVVGIAKLPEVDLLPLNTWPEVLTLCKERGII